MRSGLSEKIGKAGDPGPLADDIEKITVLARGAVGLLGAPAIIMLRDLGPLPGDTVVYTGHGDGTTVGDEAPHLEEWIKRGS